MAISPQRLTIYLYSAHRAVIFAIAQLSCFKMPWCGPRYSGCWLNHHLYLNWLFTVLSYRLPFSKFMTNGAVRMAGRSPRLRTKMSLLTVTWLTGSVEKNDALSIKPRAPTVVSGHCYMRRARTKTYMHMAVELLMVSSWLRTIDPCERGSSECRGSYRKQYW